MHQLSKYLYRTGLPIVIVSIISLTAMYRIVAFNDLKNYGERTNIILANTIANAVWPEISGLVSSINIDDIPHSRKASEAPLLGLQMVDSMLSDPINQMVQFTNVIKVKLFTIDGLTLYSTDKKNTGIKKPRSYDSISNARNGSATSHIKHHDRYTTLTGDIIYDSYIMSTYLPVYGENHNVEAIFEIYSDVTKVHDDINQSQLTFTAILIGIFSSIFIIIYFLLRNFDRVTQKNAGLTVSMDSANDASNAKSKFMTNMSHELRTPLNAIIGYSEILIEDAETDNKPEAKRDLSRIRTSATHLLSLINDILDLSKVEAGQMTLHLERVNLDKLINDVCMAINPIAKNNDNTLIIDCDKSLGFIRTDAMKLSQVLLNILSNSAKFTKNGKLTFCASRDDERLLLTIIDTGIGMNEEQLSRLYKPFEQANSDTSNVFGGTGLGMAICKEYCEMMGGSISVSSILGQGTTFMLSLPIHFDENDTQSK